MTRRSKRILMRSLTVIVVLMTGISLAGYLFLKRSLAPLDGHLHLAHLSSPVKVLRDEYGIPHIKAQNKQDALRALGYVVASERLFQMEISRRLTQGTLSEVFGEVALKSDKLYRSLGLRRAVERMLAQQKQNKTTNEKMLSEMEAFCDGINQYIATRPLPYELTLLGVHPKPFTPLDSYIMTGQMAYSFGVALKNDILMTDLAKKLTPELFSELRNDQLSTPLKIASQNLEALKPLFVASENQFFPFFDGSNSWLVGPQRSQSGKSLFANDPHISFSQPAVWFEAHIQTPEFELYGHYLPLVPFAILGHSRHHAWGFTMSETDDMDLYRETVDRNKKAVLFKKQWQPYQEFTETIHIKGAPDLALQLIETPHGPLMNEVLEEKDLALKWAYNNPTNDPLAALYKMAEAKDIKAFEEALKPGTAPGLNVMYADSENIAWWTFGEFAIKKNPNSDLILDGASGEDEYLRTLRWEEKPHSVNPPEGYIITANSRPPGIPRNLRGDWQADDRVRTIRTALLEKDQWSAEDFKSLQTSNFNVETSVVLETLLAKLQLNPSELIQYQPLLERLKAWNQHSDIESVEAAFYHQWNAENIRLILERLTDSERRAYLSTTHVWVFYKRILANEKSPWWNQSSESHLITEGFRKTAAKLKDQPLWGTLHTVEYVHPLGRSFPLNLLLNIGPYSIPGAFNEINNNKQRSLGGEDFKVLAGPSTRIIIDFANPQKSWGINPIGISGHLLSPYYKDQAPLFLEGKYRPQLMDENEIQKVKTHELIFE